jgi:DNA repair protein RadA/Sms
MRLNTGIEDIEIGTNIQDIVVPDILYSKVASGISWFDEILGGRGFTPSVATLFTGVSGSGKTTLMLMLANALQGNGAEVLFNTAEESLYQIKMTSERLRLQHPFKVGGLNNIPQLLKGCDNIREKTPDRPFFLIVDSLQCMDDGYFKSGRITCATNERVLEQLTSYCKEHAINIIVIGQVTKAGKMAGSNKLKHMVDSHLHLYIETKDEDLKGYRVLEVQKNRFGGDGYFALLDMKTNGTGLAHVATVNKNVE